jgi:adenylate cyclase
METPQPKIAGYGRDLSGVLHGKVALRAYLTSKALGERPQHLRHVCYWGQSCRNSGLAFTTGNDPFRTYRGFIDTLFLPQYTPAQIVRGRSQLMAEQRAQRRLAAILAADVVGYSRLVESNEEGTRARLVSLHIELMDPLIAADGGRIVKTMGDGFLVEFPSAVDAVHNALALQSAMRGRNAYVSENNRIDFRVGINVGDVIIEGDDIHGDGVNVAARLEGLCEPGEVYVSGTVFDQADGKLEASFEDLGEQTVKNITKSVRVYRVKGVAGPARHQTEAPSIEDKPSIAVLPFDNMSNDPDQEYFSDGMAEDLITDISKISGLAVTARNSSFAFKGQPIDVKEIAQKLRVKYIVEGSVRKMGERLRVNAQLIDGASGQHVWADRYDGNMAEIFDFQDDIREKIVSALQVNLTPADQALTERKLTDSVEAYDFFLKGRADFNTAMPENTLKAIEYFKRAIEIDPTFADAYGYLSYCYFRGWVQRLPGFGDNLDRALELAEKGVELDGTSGLTLARLGFIQAFQHRYDQAISNLEKAVALTLNDGEVYATFGQVLNYWGDPKRALKMMDKAVSLETYPPAIWEWQMGHAYLILRQYDEALTRFNRAIERAPKILPAHMHLACAYAELDRLDDARKVIRTILDFAPAFNIVNAERSFAAYRNDEDRDRLLGAFQKIGLPEV